MQASEFDAKLTEDEKERLTLYSQNIATCIKERNWSFIAYWATRCNEILSGAWKRIDKMGR